MLSYKYAAFIGFVIFLVPLVTIPTDLPLLSGSTALYYILVKLLSAFTGLCLFSYAAIIKRAYRYNNEIFFVWGMSYTVLCTMFIAEYYVVFMQILFCTTVFLPVNKKLFFGGTLATLAFLSGAILFSSTGSTEMGIHTTKYKHDSILVICVFTLTVIVGKYYLDKAMKGKKNADSLVKTQSNEIEEMMNIKSTLLKVLLHDMSNPLQMVLSASSKLDSVDKELREKSAERVFKGAKHLKQIIDNVRELEALKAGKKELDSSSVSIGTAILELEDIFDLQLKAKDITLKHQAAQHLETYVNTDQTVLVHNVLSNILSNAIKFSNRNSIISVITNNQGDRVYMSIEDNGVGIDKENLDKIFSHSESTTRLGTLGEKGTGFGLPLAKEFTHRFGGELFVESRPIAEYPDSSGTKITIVLDRSNLSM